MTSSITPNPGIHNMPALDSGAWTLPDWAQLQAWGNTLVTQIEQAIAFALLNVSVLGVKPFVALQTFGTEVLGPVTKLEQLISGLGVAAWADVVALIQAAVAIEQSWQTALNALHLPTPLSLIQQIPQSIPALLRGPDGGLSAVGGGLTRGADGAITFVEDGLTHIVQQADQAVLSLPQIGQQILHAATTVAPTLGTGVADVVNAGQTAHTALTSAIEQAGATVGADIVAGAAQLGNVVSGTVGQIEDAASVFAGEAVTGTANLGNQVASFFDGLASYWAGTPPPSSGAPVAINAAAAAAAAAQALAAQQTAAINAQLPHFYGGGSAAASTNIEQNFTGLTSLPAGFASVSTIAGASAQNATTAQTSSQTTSAIWSISDQYAKYLFLRMNAAGTTYIYAKVQNNSLVGVGNCEIGCVVAGSRHIFVTFALPGTGNVVSNNVYTFEATGNVFRLTGPDGLNQSYTDGISGGAPSVSQWDPDNTTHVYGYGGFGTDGSLLDSRNWTSPGTYTYTPPAGLSTDIFDGAAVGAGGGAQGGGTFNSGQGGYAGTWGTGSFTRSALTGSITISVGGGGAGGIGAYGGGTHGGTGGAGTITAPGYGAISGSGGAGGSVNSLPIQGGSPGDQDFDNKRYYGGATSGGFGAWGGTPGAGGNGGNEGFAPGPGGPGGNAGAWIDVYTLALPGTMYSWAFYDSGPSSGPGGAFVATDETTASPTYVKLATTTDQIEINVGNSGMVQVFLGAEFYNTSGTHDAYVSFALSGANNVTAAAMEGLGKFIKNGSSSAKSGEPFMLYNLVNGPTLFDMEYRTDGTGTGHFANRSIDVTPL